MGSLSVGADTRVITPRLEDAPVYLAGFQGNRRAEAIHLDLRVRTVALADGGRPFVLAVCDLVGLVRRDTLAIRDAVADLGADLVVAATHTHSGPDTIGLWGPDDRTSGVESSYLAFVRSEVAGSVRAAVTSLAPATLRVASTEVAGIIQNYRDPDVLDTQVGVLAFDASGNGAPIATLVNVGVHPEVLDGESRSVSSDMAGACCLALEAERGGVAVWVSGDLGGMQSPAEGPRTPEEVRRKGKAVASAALHALSGAELSSDVRVAYRGAEVDLPLWNPRFREGLKAGLLRGELQPDDTLRTDIGVLDLGPTRAACWPGEVLPRLGLVSKARLGTPYPFLFGLANDEIGYILSDDEFAAPDDWDDPDPHYEESMSVGPTTGSRLLAALDALTDAIE